MDQPPSRRGSNQTLKGVEKSFVGRPCSSLLTGRGLTWRGFAHFGHVRASATLAAHGILTLRVLLTSDMSAISRWRLTLPLPQPPTAVREKPNGLRCGVRLCVTKTPQL
eukprot:superscaffoldBa00002726_g15113